MFQKLTRELPGHSADFLFVLVGSAGDVLPGLTLAKHLSGLGHRAWVLTNAHFQQTVESAGVGFLANGTQEDYFRLTQHPDLWKPFKGTRLLLSDPRFSQLHEEQLSMTQEWIRDRKPGTFAVIGSTLALGTRLLRSAQAFPLASLHLSPIAFRSLENPPKLALNGGLMGWLHRKFPKWFRNQVDRWIIDPILETQLGRLRKNLGVPRIRGWFTDWMHSPDLVMAPFPSWFATAGDYPPQTRQYDFLLCGNDSPLPGEVAAFLDRGAPPVVVTLGSAMAQANQVFASIGQVARSLGQRVLFLTQHPEQITFDPGNHFIARWAPLGPVFSRSCLIAHHGGIGTTAQSLAAGRPQLIFPFAHDQADNAERLERLGCALAHDPHALRPHLLKKQMESLLHSQNRAGACSELATRVGDRHPVEAMAQDISQLATSFVKGSVEN